MSKMGVTIKNGKRKMKNITFNDYLKSPDDCPK